MFYGIAEKDFWEMTILELERAIKSQQKIDDFRRREKANFDYRLADLIGRSISRIYNSNNKMPPISEVYPELFSSEEIQEAKRQQQEELSILRFKQFVYSHNKNYVGGKQDG